MSRRHVIPALHNAPDLPADARVAEPHDDQRYNEDHDEHINLVGSQQESGLGVTHAPICDPSQPDLLVCLKRKVE